MSAAAAQPVPRLEKPANGWIPMLFIGMGTALIIMDATIVNVSLPSMIRDLSLSSIDAEWVNAIYALTFAALLIIFGRIGDRVGRRRMFTLGAAVFVAASIYAAASRSGEHLITARALQGIGGAMMSPTSLSLVNSLYSGRSRNVAFAIYGSIIGGMAALGPLVGGFLTTSFSWTWAFWINVPIGMIVIIGAVRVVPESKDPGDTPGLDIMGALLSALGIGLLVFGLIEGRNYGWWSAKPDVSIGAIDVPEGALSPVAIAMLVSVASLIALYFVETWRTSAGKTVLIDFSLFRIRTFGLGSAAALIVSLGEFGILFSLPLFLQSVLGYTALGAGALLATLAIGSFVSAPTAAMLANRYGARFVARMGMALEVVGIVGLGLIISPSSTAWQMAIWLIIYGMGVGYASAQLTGLILADVPVRQSGQASGTQSTARQVGSAMGTAVLGTVLFLSLNTQTEARVSEVGVPVEAAQQLADVVEGSAGTAIPGLDQPPGSPQIQAAAGQAFADSLSQTAFVAGGFVFLGLIFTLALPKPVGRREDDDPGLAPVAEAPSGR
ncbi:MAG: DHA2 family efflux MFS transporter permease subunit [Candidatus Nanopelagicales bacterium]